MRRKASAVLMFLITRPGFVANREQIIDELWPESDPASGTNNLNQSLYYLRRDIDPWYEDDLSLDYVRFQGDLVWLERDLVSAESVQFITVAHESMSDPPLLPRFWQPTQAISRPNSNTTSGQLLGAAESTQLSLSLPTAPSTNSSAIMTFLRQHESLRRLFRSICKQVTSKDASFGFTAGWVLSRRPELSTPIWRV